VRPDPAASLDARRLAVVAALRAVRDEDTVELLGERDEAPLSWPTPVTTDSALEVPPLEVSRKSSPAFDVLLGPPPVKQERDTA
jgi:hypothetical protein